MGKIDENKYISYAHPTEPNRIACNSEYVVGLKKIVEGKTIEAILSLEKYIKNQEKTIRDEDDCYDSTSEYGLDEKFDYYFAKNLVYSLK